MIGDRLNHVDLRVTGEEEPEGSERIEVAAREPDQDGQADDPTGNVGEQEVDRQLGASNYD